MKSYVAVTGIIFGLLTIAHIWRAFAESMRFATDPVYILITALSAALCVWAARLMFVTRAANSAG